jgi:hypothetical protein
MPLPHSVQVGRTDHNQRGTDLYETPCEVTLALLDAERLPRILFEPCCGRGAITRILRALGHTVHSRDIVDYHSPDQDAGGQDFLLASELPSGTEAIVTNPPYQFANEFVAHAIEFCPLVVMLLRLAFLEGTKRTPILEGAHLARVHVFRNRLPAMHRDGWTGPKASTATPYAWFVWDRLHSGPPEIRRLSWQPSATAHHQQSEESGRQL